MRVEFDIIFELSNTSNETFMQAQQNFYKSLRQNQIHGKLNNLINTTGQMVAQRIQHMKIILDCPENTVESLRTFSCGLYFFNFCFWFITILLHISKIIRKQNHSIIWFCYFQWNVVQGLFTIMKVARVRNVKGDTTKTKVDRIPAYHVLEIKLQNQLALKV